MSNESTKEQIREFLERAIKKAQSPDLREQLKRAREKKKTVVAKQFGL
jgi:hypothetical protein